MLRDQCKFTLPLQQHTLIQYKFATNKGRRSPFNQTLINGEIRIERQVPPAGMVMTGMYMRIIVSSPPGPNPSSTNFHTA